MLDSNDFGEHLKDEGYNSDSISDETWKEIEEFLDEQNQLVINNASGEIFKEAIKKFKIKKRI